VFYKPLIFLSFYNSSPALLSRIFICVLLRDVDFGCLRGMTVLGVKQSAAWFLSGLARVAILETAGQKVLHAQRVFYVPSQPF
jgi:hypothetical protein